MTDLYIGIMSGTSLDGVDAVLADFSGTRPKQIAQANRPFSSALRSDLLALCQSGADEIHRSQLAASALAALYAGVVTDTLETAGVMNTEIQAIGCHGQTVRHMPAYGYSLQINAPALLAEKTGIRVVSDFRVRDIAAGGEGAPLVPAFHARMFADQKLIRVVLNLGGMSNVTLLEPGKPVRGFDCGPANILMDAWIERQLGFRYDASGRWAAGGHADPDLLDRMLAHPFFALTPPKSCGREQFNLGWLNAMMRHDLRPEDVQATLAELTARSVIDALLSASITPDEIAVCGGGAFNTHVMNRLERLSGVRVFPTSDWGIAPETVESLAFAWLARCALRGEPGNLPDVTGASGPRVLGAIWPA